MGEEADSDDELLSILACGVENPCAKAPATDADVDDDALLAMILSEGVDGDKGGKAAPGEEKPAEAPQPDPPPPPVPPPRASPTAVAKESPKGGQSPPVQALVTAESNRRDEPVPPPPKPPVEDSRQLDEEDALVADILASEVHQKPALPTAAAEEDDDDTFLAAILGEAASSAPPGDGKQSQVSGVPTAAKEGDGKKAVHEAPPPKSPERPRTESPSSPSPSRQSTVSSLADVPSEGSPKAAGGLFGRMKKMALSQTKKTDASPTSASPPQAASPTAGWAKSLRAKVDKRLASPSPQPPPPISPQPSQPSPESTPSIAPLQHLASTSSLTLTPSSSKNLAHPTQAVPHQSQDVASSPDADKLLSVRDEGRKLSLSAFVNRKRDKDEDDEKRGEKKGFAGGLFRKEKKKSLLDQVESAMSGGSTGNPAEEGVEIIKGADAVTLEEERLLLQKVIEELEEDEAAVTTVADSELGLNEPDVDVEMVLRAAERIAQKGKEPKDGRLPGGLKAPSSPVREATVSMMKQSHLADIGSELSQHRSTVGWPICLAVAPKAVPLPGRQKVKIMYAVGTSNGVILLFSDLGKRAGILGGGSSSEDNKGMCTCLDLQETGEALVAGYQSGTLVVYETNSGAVMKTIEGELLKPVHSALWLKHEGHRIAALDINGTVKVVSLRKLPGLKAKYLSQVQGVEHHTGPARMDIATVSFRPCDVLSKATTVALGSVQDAMSYIPLLASASRAKVFVHRIRFQTTSLGSACELLYSSDNPHYCPPEKDRDKRDDAPPQRSIARRGSMESSRSGLATRPRRGTMSGRRKREDEKRKHEAELRMMRSEALPSLSWVENGMQLAVLWCDYIMIFRFNAEALLRGGDWMHVVAHIPLHQPMVASAFLSPRVLCVIDSQATIAVLDPRTESSRAIADVCSTSIEPVQIQAFEMKKSIRQSVKCMVHNNSGCVLMLGKSPIRLTRVEVLTWQERLDLVSPDIAALKLARDLRNDKAPAMGLPTEEKERARVIGMAIRSLLKEYMAAQIAKGPHKDEDPDEWWRALGKFLFKYCCTTATTDALFSVVFRRFVEAGVTNVWVQLLEPCVVRGQIRGMPSDFLPIVVEWLTRGAVLTFHHEGPSVFGGKSTIEKPYDAVHNPPNIFTVDLKVKPTKRGPEQCPLASMDVLNRSGWWFVGTDVWSFRIGNGDEFQQLKGGQVEAGKWVRLTAQYNHTEVTFFVNERTMGTMQCTFRPNTRAPLFIGGAISQADGAGFVPAFLFSGEVKDVKIFSSIHDPFERPLDDAAGFEINEDGTVGGNEAHAPTWNNIMELKASMAPSSLSERLTLTDVCSAVSEAVSDNSSSDEWVETTDTPNMVRLENFLLHLDPKEMYPSYDVVRQTAEDWFLYRALATCCNKKAGHSVEAYVEPLELLYSRFSTPLVGSVVVFKEPKPHLQGVQGHVVGVHGADEAMTLDVKWEGDDSAEVQSVLADRVDVVTARPPNSKAGAALLQYIRLVLSGRTFHNIDIPRTCLGDVKRQVFEFLFTEDAASPSKKKNAQRGYPVLQSLLHFDAGHVMQSLAVSFTDESMAHSPWKRVLQPGNKPPLEQRKGQDCFRLSRDKVVAILMSKLGIMEFKANEPAKTAARDWPAFDHVVAFLKLVATSIAREVLLLEKMKNAKDVMFRICSHLAHYSVQHPDEAEELQHIIEGMLKVAFRPDMKVWTEGPTPEEVGQLMAIAQEAGFNKLMIYLHRRDGNYSAVLQTYLCDEKSAKQVFAFLHEIMEEMGDEGVDSGHSAKLDDAIVSHLQELVKVDSAKAAGLIVRHLPMQHAEILRRFENEKVDWQTQFEYMKGLMEANTEEVPPDNPQERRLPAPFRDKATVERCIRLFCEFDQAALLDFIRAHEGIIEIPRMLKLVQDRRHLTWEAASEDNAGRENAIVYLYSRMGSFTEALKKLCGRIYPKMQALRQRLIVQARKDFAHHTPITPSLVDPGSPALTISQHQSKQRSVDDSSRMMIRPTSLLVGGEENTRWGLHDILTSPEGRTVTELIQLGVTLCSDSSHQGGSVDAFSGWMDLLGTFIRPKKILMEIENESREWSCLEAAEAGALVVTVMAAPRRRQRSTSLSNHPPHPMLDSLRDTRHVETPERVDEEPIDELGEVTNQQSHQQKSWKGPQGKVTSMPAQKKRLSKSLSPVLMAINHRMRDIYTYYIQDILLMMMDSQQTHQDSEAMNAQRKKVLEYKATALGRTSEDKAYKEYLRARDELCEMAGRVEMVIMRRITEDHLDAPLADFKVILRTILENARFERSLQSAFHSCVAADMHALELKSLRGLQAALRPRPQWGPVCALCRNRLRENTDSLCFFCGHVFHSSCLGGPVDEKRRCPLCHSRKKIKPVTPAAPPAPAATPGSLSQKRLDIRLRHLDIRLACGQRQDFLAAMRGEGDSLDSKSGSEIAKGAYAPLCLVPDGRPEPDESLPDDMLPTSDGAPAKGEVTSFEDLIIFGVDAETLEFDF